LVGHRWCFQWFVHASGDDIIRPRERNRCKGSSVAQLIVHNLSDRAKERLKARAKRNGRSLEAEARSILEEAVKGERPVRRPSATKKGLGTRIAERFKGIGLTKEEKRLFDKTIEDMWRSNPPRSVDFEK